MAFSIWLVPFLCQKEQAESGAKLQKDLHVSKIFCTFAVKKMAFAIICINRDYYYGTKRNTCMVSAYSPIAGRHIAMPIKIFRFILITLSNFWRKDIKNFALCKKKCTFAQNFEL